MPTPQKEAQVNELQEKLSKAKAVLFVDYRGLNVKEDTELRHRLRKAGVEYKVAKNTLTGIAAKNIGLTDLNSFLAGPTSIAFGYDDPVAPAKILSEFAKENKKLEFKGGLLEGKKIGVEQIKALASLPPKDVLLGQLLSTLQAPIRNLANVVQGPIRKLVYALEAIRKEREA